MNYIQKSGDPVNYIETVEDLIGIAEKYFAIQKVMLGENDELIEQQQVLKANSQALVKNLKDLSELSFATPDEVKKFNAENTCPTHKQTIQCAIDKLEAFGRDDNLPSNQGNDKPRHKILRILKNLPLGWAIDSQNLINILGQVPQPQYVRLLLAMIPGTTQLTMIVVGANKNAAGQYKNVYNNPSKTSTSNEIYDNLDPCKPGTTCNDDF